MSLYCLVVLALAASPTPSARPSSVPYRQSLSSADRNYDGKVSLLEYVRLATRRATADLQVAHDDMILQPDPVWAKAFEQAAKSLAEETAKAKQDFAAADANHDGALDEHETDRLEARQPARPAYSPGTEAKLALRRLDANHDGAINLSEYEAFRVRGAAEARAYAVDQVAEAEARHDAAKLKSSRRMLEVSDVGLQNLRDNAWHIFKLIDRNHDGRLTEDELVSDVVKSLQP